MRQKQGLNKLYLLHPKYLTKEVHMYGYYFSWKRYLCLIICTCIGMVCVGSVFRLKMRYMIVVLGCVLLMLPMCISYGYRRMYEQKRFFDASMYAEQILYSFQKNNKIISALKETQQIFENGQMWWTLNKAITYLEQGNTKSENGLMREALQLIEDTYSCAKIHMIHELLINSEEQGGENSESILLLLNDIELWKRRNYMLQAKKNVSNRDNLISLGIAVVMCAVALYTIDGMCTMFPGMEHHHIFANEIIQVSSVLFLLLLLWILLKCFRDGTKDWLKSSMLQEESYLLHCYQMVKSVEQNREHGNKRKPMGYAIAQRDVSRAMYIMLPQWMMEIALLLQHNTVQVSIVKTIEQAPTLLKEELILVKENLEKYPEELRSYTDFCKAFNVPEAQSCMKMLHAMAENGTGNAKIQIHNLMQRVYEMQNRADDVWAEEAAFQVKLFFSYPVFATTGKLLVDLTVGMFYIFQLLGRMGN